MFALYDPIEATTSRVTQTYGQDWNDAPKRWHESRAVSATIRTVSHGNQLTEDKPLSHVKAQDVVANPPSASIERRTSEEE